jgi:hypothetical protein
MAKIHQRLKETANPQEERMESRINDDDLYTMILRACYILYSVKLEINTHFLY